MAVQFATDTGANLSLHDLSVRNLSADYDHFMDCKSTSYYRVEVHIKNSVVFNEKNYKGMLLPVLYRE